MSESRSSITDIWGKRTPFQGVWPPREDFRTRETPEKWVPSVCTLCSTGCGIELGVASGRIVGVRGRASDPASRGRLGPKGLHGWEANGAADRLRHPLVRRNGRLGAVSWDEALDEIVGMTRELMAEDPASIAFLAGGHLSLEECYTLAVVGLAGIGTPRLHGSHGLGSIAAAFALRESFGAAIPPGSFADIDTAETILHVGHNPASQNTVLWSRILDRRRGPLPPRIILIDPRRTETAREADVHLRPSPGTDLALLNGLLHLVIEQGMIDHSFIEMRTTGFAALKQTVGKYTPQHVESVTGVPAGQLREAASIIGRSARLISTVQSGIYQGRQGTETAIQVNNLHLVRGLVGRSGCAILQMPGQPGGTNLVETGFAGTLPGMRNPQNRAHVEELAAILGVAPETIPLPSHPATYLSTLDDVSNGTVRMLWVAGANPAVSLPDLPRIREILNHHSLFLIVQDPFFTETAQYADVVLPSALWGDKGGCITSADRTVRRGLAAVPPPGDARSDFDIFVDFADRIGFTRLDGTPLVPWKTLGEAFQAWQLCSHGRPCDYSGIDPEALLALPVRAAGDGFIFTTADLCESHGHDSKVEAAPPDERNRARLKGAEFRPIEPEPDYPFTLISGRIVYHWHTRTRTARCPALHEAAPEVFLEISPEDAEAYDIADNEEVEIRSASGYVRARAAIVEAVRPGELFLPFHYGYWDNDGTRRAANELTAPSRDGIGGQPELKRVAVDLRKLRPWQ